MRTCPKCGAESRYIRYHAPDWCIPVGVHNSSRDEHLHATCQTCGYDWITPVVSRDSTGVDVAAAVATDRKGSK